MRYNFSLCACLCVCVGVRSQSESPCACRVQISSRLYDVKNDVMLQERHSNNNETEQADRV